MAHHAKIRERPWHGDLEGHDQAPGRHVSLDRRFQGQGDTLPFERRFDGQHGIRKPRPTLAIDATHPGIGRPFAPTRLMRFALDDPRFLNWTGLLVRSQQTL